jgi:hypothetical protein
MKKKDISLYDQLALAAPTPVDPPRQHLLAAQRFMLDQKASHFYGHISRDIGPLVLRQHEFARPPYDQTWVEFDMDAFSEEVPTTAMYDHDGRDTQVGFLFDYGTAWVFSRNARGLGGCMPYRIRLHHPLSSEDELRMARALGLSRVIYRMMLLGPTGHDSRDPWWEGPEADHICRSHTLVFHEAFWPILERLSDEEKFKFMALSAGTLRQVLVIALLLSRQSHRYWTIIGEPHRSALVSGKHRVLTAHNRVTMHLERAVARQRFLEDIHTGAHRREHDVRGHWAQNRRSGSNCDHLWVENDEDHFHCGMCSVKRWWRHAHKRGDASIGTVVKTYEVTR